MQFPRFLPATCGLTLLLGSCLVAVHADDENSTPTSCTYFGAEREKFVALALAAMGKRDGLIERIDRALPAARAAGTYFDLVVLLVLRSSLNEGVRPELIEERDKLLDQLGIVAVRVLVQVP